MRITKAVIAVAGFGTRFLPATKVVPKEMLPVVDKPIVQYLVEEAVDSGIEDIILVTRSGAHAITDHFDSSRGLETHLAEQGKDEYLEIIQAIPRTARFAFLRQGNHLPYGNGTPLLVARTLLGNEPFVYMFGDDLVLSKTPCTKQLIDVYQKHQPAAVIAFKEIPRSEAYRYGMARLKENTEPKEMESIVEKPSPEASPSTLAQVGRFVLSPRVIEILQAIEVGQGKELYLTHAIDQLCKEGRVLVHPIEGTWHTTGDPLRFLMANIDYALHRPELRDDLVAYLRGLDLSRF